MFRDEHLRDDRARRARRFTDRSIVDRQCTPAEHLEVLFAGDLLDQLSKTFALVLRVRQEDEPGAVFPGRRQGDAERRRDLSEEAIGNLDEDAGAVTGVGLAAARAAVQQVDQHLQPLLDDAVRAPSLDVDDEADTARVVLVTRIVQTMSGGRGVAMLGRHRDAQLSRTPMQKLNTMIASNR
jgi:hypothetical protein